MTKKQVKKIADKISKVSDSFIVHMYDNGFMFEVGGRDSNNDYKTAKIMVDNLIDLAALVQEATEMERDE